MNRYIRLFFHSGAFSPVQLWECFFDDEVIDLIVHHTNEFAAQSNAVGFGGATRDLVKTFLGICYTTGFNTLPSIKSYWSPQPILANPCLKAVMGQDTFLNLKKYFHVCDNLNLGTSDKFAKVTPFNDLLNKRFMQFGIFSHHLSIDEQMIAYYGRNSCKMFIEGKPIRFGYKYWCLTSAEGYLYQFIPYAGASARLQSVTMLSNFIPHLPLCHAKRYDRKQRKMTTIDQPQMIYSYNQRMGGGDLFDNAMNNYRIKVRGKKWYWPLLTNGMDAAMVNAWKLHVFCRKYDKQKCLSQFEFRVAVTEGIMKIMPNQKRPTGRSLVSEGMLQHQTDGINHLISNFEIRRRCGHCNNKTTFGCAKCVTNLHPKCFSAFHGQNASTSGPKATASKRDPPSTAGPAAKRATRKSK